MCGSVSLHLLFHPSYLCVTRGQGGVTENYECESVFAYSVQVYRPLPVFAWPMHDCIGHNGPNLTAEEFFLWVHVGQPMCWCVQRAWSDSASHAALRPPSIVHCCTCQRFRSHQVFASTCCPATEMIFIPLGMLDKLPLSPLTKHILGRVGSSLLIF